jgi:hypothetical protein
MEQSARSLLLDSEVTLKRGLRRLLEEKGRVGVPLLERVECRLFDHAIGLATIRVANHLHRPGAGREARS